MKMIMQKGPTNSRSKPKVGQKQSEFYALDMKNENSLCDCCQTKMAESYKNYVKLMEIQTTLQQKQSDIHKCIGQNDMTHLGNPTNHPTSR